MYSKKTVFVIGAGASKEFDLPLGNELIEKISRRLKSSLENVIDGQSDVLLDTCLKLDINREKFINAARRIKLAMVHAKSIDEYIGAQIDDPHIVTVCKAAIIDQILEAERNSALSVENRLIGGFRNPDTVRSSWVKAFFSNAYSGIQKQKIDSLFSNVIIISFNYDRCIKHYLYYALQEYYGCTLNEAVRAISNLTILHPYGSLGKLPWELDAVAEKSCAFGAPPEQPETLLDQIYTFNEQSKLHLGTLYSIRNSITEAHAVVILGCYMHPQNLRILNPNKDVGIPRVYATAKDMSPQLVADYDQKIRRNILSSMQEHMDRRSNGFVSVFPGTASELFTTYGSIILE